MSTASTGSASASSSSAAGPERRPDLEKPSATPVMIGVEALRRFTVQALSAVGVSPENAATTAQVLVTTDSWGIFTHGTKSLPGYIRRLQAGGLSTTALPRALSDGPAWMIADGQSSLGMVTSVWCMEQAIAKARQCGIAYVTANNSCHFGAAGYYAAMAAEVGMIGLAMANDAPSMTIPGARGRVLGNNPFAVAIPSSGFPLMLDIAMSTVAGGKITSAHALGQDIPNTWCVDKDGRPTTTAGDFMAGGALTPMAGHKGYGLALMVEALSAVISGASIASQVGSWILDDPATPTGHGAAFIAVNVPAMMPREVFARRIDGLISEMRSAPRAEGCDRIYLPGEMEHERRAASLRSGIPMPPPQYAGLLTLAEELHLEAKALLV